jgi:hypothetical protein
MSTPITLVPPPRPARPTVTPPTDTTDITRGATQFGIRRASVFVETQVLADYQEIDPAVGLNVIGIILTVLYCRLAMPPGAGPGEPLIVCLLRRTDGRLVEVELTLHHSRGPGGETITLQRTTEQLEFLPAAHVRPTGSSLPAPRPVAPATTEAKQR